MAAGSRDRGGRMTAVAAAPSAPPVVDFLVRAARAFTPGSWVFVGFHWPVLAGQLAAELSPQRPPVQCFEAGAATIGAGRQIPTSTTDYPAYADALGWTGSTTDALLGLARRFDRVVLDAGTVDMAGRVNSSFVGDRARPRVRLPGGGGSADIAAAARDLVWLHGGADPQRLQRRVEHVTAAPAPEAIVRLHTRWGVVRLGAQPSVESLVDGPGTGGFLARMGELGVAVDGYAAAEAVPEDQRRQARDLLDRAAERGYEVAVRARYEENR